MEQGTWKKIVVTIAGVLLIILIMVFAVNFFLNPGEDSTTPTAPAASDISLAKIIAAGKVRVGVSGDYPPFAYFNSNNQLDGFDVALMGEIAKKIGVTPEYYNFAFDGLGGALYLDQLDVAIAAISVTPERDALLDFSVPYYSGLGAALGRADSTLSITNIDQLVGQRIGVQKGTVYQTKVQKELIDTGKMGADKMFVYANADELVRDLKENRVDVALMDDTPAKNFAAQGGIKIIGTGVVQQQYAIAVKGGSTELVNAINKAIFELNNEGKLTTLYEQYLQGSVFPTPVPTPQATLTPAPTTAPPACVHGMAFVADLNYDDYDMTNPPVMQPGQGFTKQWRVQNVGTCPWTTGFRLGYVYGNSNEARMGGQDTYVTRTVNPGENYDFAVNLIAPQVPGVYQGFWQMVDDKNTHFGQTIWVGIQVPGPATATLPVLPTATTPPQPTATTAPSLPGTTWTVTFLNGQQVVVDPSMPMSMQFVDAANVQGYTGCNNYTGSYVVNGETIKFANVAGGRSVCPDAARTNQETAFYNALQTQATYFQVSGVQLMIYDINRVEIIRADLRK